MSRSDGYYWHRLVQCHSSSSIGISSEGALSSLRISSGFFSPSIFGKVSCIISIKAVQGYTRDVKWSRLAQESARTAHKSGYVLGRKYKLVEL